MAQRSTRQQRLEASRRELREANDQVEDLKSQVRALETHKREAYHVFRSVQIERDAWRSAFDGLMEHHKKVYRE